MERSGQPLPSGRLDQLPGGAIAGLALEAERLRVMMRANGRNGNGRPAARARPQFAAC
jgi:hypothetical protein